MKSNDFLVLSKRNIFHSYMQCHAESDSKYIPNYPPTVIVNFYDEGIMIKDYCTKKILDKILYEDVLAIDLSLCSRLMTIKFVPTKMYDVEYTIKKKTGENLHFEGKNALIWKNIFKILNKNHVIINDELGLQSIINNLQNSEEFYDICKERMASWKEKYSISNPKVGDLI